MVFESLEHGRAKLREAFSDSNLDRAVVCQPLRNPVAQISYLQKFSTYHRPGQLGFSSRGRAYPMKPKQLGQLARVDPTLLVRRLFVCPRTSSSWRAFRSREWLQASSSLKAHAPGDGGDGGDGLKRYSETPQLHHRRECPVLHPPTSIPIDCTAFPDSKRAIREDKHRTLFRRQPPNSVPHRRH